LFKNWKQGEVPQKNIGEVELPEKPKVYILDRPGSIQSIIFAGHIAPPYNTPEQIAIETMNNILGGEFTSRINMNLREDKHWSYGARSFLVSARGQRPFIAYAPVQSDKTKESMVEIYKELTDFVTTRPPTMEEFTKVQTNRILSLPGSWETMASVSGSISNMIQYGLSDDYYQNYANTIKDLKLANILESSKQVLKPSNLVWVVVGDRSQIEEGIKELEYGEIHLINMDGEVLQ
jgi:zinc protease